MEKVAKKKEAKAEAPKKMPSEQKIKEVKKNLKNAEPPVVVSKQQRNDEIEFETVTKRVQLTQQQILDRQQMEAMKDSFFDVNPSEKKEDLTPIPKDKPTPKPK